jgi:exopolysaccharide biosynthesis polyprenyl glycosylphosphotransferase
VSTGAVNGYAIRRASATRTLADVPEWRRWRRTYTHALVGLDALAMLAAALLGLVHRFGTTHVVAPGGLPYTFVLLCLIPAWLGVLAISGCYDARALGIGSDEFKRIANAAVRTLAVVATVAYAAKIELARGFVAITLPAAAVATLALRYAARKVLHRIRAGGGAGHRVLVIGCGEPARELITTLRKTPFSGLNVLGICMPGGRREDEFDDVPVFGSLSNFAEALRRANADTVAVAHSPGITPKVLQSLAWELEGTGVDLVVAPALTNIAGPRINVRPVSGLPLLHIDEPELSGPARVVKGAFDRVGAVLLIAALSPVLLLSALAVRLTSRGPAFFKQVRVGRDGHQFLVWKFRTMVHGADRQHAAMQVAHDRDGHVLFKMKGDPRITRIGHWLRKHSLDELPQLFNVVAGEMSLVGPRPPLPSEVERYEHSVHRRLLVKPGLTGLWQVSGRADLPWDESVRLDLYYVENWSLAMDFMILWKTFGAVVRGAGAY